MPCAPIANADRLGHPPPKGAARRARSLARRSAAMEIVDLSREIFHRTQTRSP
jgi:hypothetical protein